MLETPVLLENSSGGGGGAAAAAAPELRNDGGEELGDWNSAGNRWPHEETLALLKIRSEMDLAFRDSTHKGPLWDEVSRYCTSIYILYDICWMGDGCLFNFKLRFQLFGLDCFSREIASSINLSLDLSCCLDKYIS